MQTLITYPNIFCKLPNYCNHVLGTNYVAFYCYSLSKSDIFMCYILPVLKWF